jgi:hypothetical protein
VLDCPVWCWTACFLFKKQVSFVKKRIILVLDSLLFVKKQVSLVLDSLLFVKKTGQFGAGQPAFCKKRIILL